MKTFVFKEVTYQNLNDLGLAFAQNFKEALNTIREKTFLQFLSQFKTYAQMRITLYETKYLQNALSFLIYQMTEDHQLVIAGKNYTLESIFRAIGENVQAVDLFLLEKGLQKTLLPSLEDEKLKADIVTFEENKEDPFARRFISTYFNYDSLESAETYLKPFTSAKEDYFAQAWKVFRNEEFQLLLAHQSTLKNVLELRAAPCCVFRGFRLVQPAEDEFYRMVLKDSFVWHLAANIKKYRFLGKTKPVRKKILKLWKTYRKNERKKDWTLDQFADLSEQMYECYQEVVMGFKNHQIKVRNVEDELTASYCQTFVSQSYIRNHSIVLFTEDTAREEAPAVRPLSYSLPKIYREIKSHRRYAFALVLFSAFFGIYYLVFFLLEKFIEDFEFSPLYLPDVSYDSLIPILYFISLGLCLSMGIFLWIRSAVEKKNYHDLCRLSYFRKNPHHLTQKEEQLFSKTEKKEATSVRKITRFYRFYGAFGNLFLSFGLTVLTYSLCFHFLADLSIFQSMDHLWDSMNSYLLLIPSVVGFCLGLLRRKKSFFSALWIALGSVVLTVVILYLSTYL